MAELNDRDDLAVHLSGLREGRFLIPECNTCDRPWWPPRAACPRCQSSSFSWADMPSHMRVFSWTVAHRTPLKDFQNLTPYAVSILESESGEFQVVGRIDGEPDRIAIDDECTWEIVTAPTGEAVPLWYLTKD